MFLGNACTGFNVGYGWGGLDNGCGITGAYGSGPIAPASEIGAVTSGGWDGYPVYTVDL